MKKTLLSTTTVALCTLSLTSALANEKSTKVVYGDDNRIETYEASALQKRLANSTAGMIDSIKTIKVGDKVMLPPYSIKHDMGLCSTERFSEQPSAVVCSGFLVGPDLLVTAGHCITTQEDCQKVSWVFDYKINEKNKKADIMVPASNVYRCKQLIEAKLESTQTYKKDYSLIRLERVVKGRTPLKFRTMGKVATNTDILVIGHPSGLPQKVAAGAQVLENTAANYFQTNLDTFGGNSGSAVFDAKTGKVEGILVRGAKDYEESDKGCRIVHKTTQQISDFSRYGESVSRITDIKTLKNMESFLEAASDGNMVEVEKLASEMADLSVMTDDLNTAMHLAAANNHVEVLRFLKAKKVNIDAQNSIGETALHLAAFNNAKEAIAFLINNDADTLIKDNTGSLARDRTNYLAFGTRSLMKKAEIAQKKKKNIQ